MRLGFGKLVSQLLMRVSEIRIWDLPKFRVPYFGVLFIRILLFRVPYYGPLFSETPIWNLGSGQMGQADYSRPNHDAEVFHGRCQAVDARCTGLDPKGFSPEKLWCSPFARRGFGQLQDVRLC